MAATINITSYHGAAGGTTNNVDGGALRFKVADDDVADANAPVPIPAAGTNYSYIKQLRLNASVAPSNVLNNIRFYTDGGNGFGTGIALNVRTNATYTNPLTQGTTALTGTANAFTYTSASPLAVAGSLTAPSTGPFGDYVQLQAAVSSTAVAGTSPGEVLTFAVDES